jgi:pimeloyl-ACP methyl ester carboxylesterase
MVCLHGLMDTWRSWELVLPTLTRHHDVLAPTLAGHAGASPTMGEVSGTSLVDAVETAMDTAGFPVADIVGNSLGGYVALRLAERGRARSVVALAPAGGWAAGDDAFRATLAAQSAMRGEVKQAAPHAESILASIEGRRRTTQLITVDYEHIPIELLAHMLRGAAACHAVDSLIHDALRHGWPLHPEEINCPLRVIWGTDDRLLPWPLAALGYRESFPTADWIELDSVGHCRQLDRPLEVASLILDFTAG